MFSVPAASAHFGARENSDGLLDENMEATTTPEGDSADASGARLSEGSNVELIGLQTQHHLNGREATLKKFHSESGRWQLRVDGDTLLVKPENLTRKITRCGGDATMDVDAPSKPWGKHSRFVFVEWPGTGGGHCTRMQDHDWGQDHDKKCAVAKASIAFMDRNATDAPPR
jgi:hypothetical protein